MKFLTAMLLILCSLQVSAQMVVAPKSASTMERIAAHEVRRYVYLRTGKLLTIGYSDVPTSGLCILIGRQDRTLVNACLPAAKIKPQAFSIHTSRGVTSIIGGDDTGVLYGAYRYVEKLGVGFSLDTDAIPDQRLALLPPINDNGAPLFELRGIQPFHDFPEGPDWWTLDDYRAIIGQLPKLGMNFFGLHTYPEGIAEPAVWIGTDADLRPDGLVKKAYPSSWHNTLRNGWGYQPKKTGNFSYGASQLFDRDDFGASVGVGLTPLPKTAEEGASVFNRSGELLHGAFSYARKLGVKTCIGTETPLTIPVMVRDRLKAQGMNPDDPAVKHQIYSAMFKRISKTYPVDYYWLWTPEDWTWSGAKKEQVDATIQDIQIAFDSIKDSAAPFTLATCGWVLGPPGNRAGFDKILPKTMPVSCINRMVGNEPVDPGFAQVKGRDKWAIPWLEDDPGLTGAQLWAGRMRRDAMDALSYGCTGLLGIHWRTRAIAPNVSALAKAGWNQTGFRRQLTGDQVVGGSVVEFPNAKVDQANPEEIYRSVRYGMSAYNLKVPDGNYKVTLRFCEPHYDKAGVRMFDVSLQGKRVIEGLDIIAKVGKNHALDYDFPGVVVSSGSLNIEFTAKVEFPCIAGIEVVGNNIVRRINCGGPKFGDFLADLTSAPRGLPVDDFYTNWAKEQFGGKSSARIGAIFSKLDGRIPRPLDWTDGPGGLTPDGRNWVDLASDFAFIDEYRKLLPSVHGGTNRERFTWWLNEFEYIRTVARLRCFWGEFNRAMAGVRSEKDSALRSRMAETTVLPIRRAIITQLGEVFQHLLATVSNTGELGTVANWEQHILPALLEAPGKDLTEALGRSLPQDAVPSTEYTGPTRLIIPTVRRSLDQGEPLRLRAIVLTSSPSAKVILSWRPLGQGAYKQLPFKNVRRGVYETILKPDVLLNRDIEYNITATPSRGEPLLWPASAPQINQTVIYL